VYFLLYAAFFQTHGCISRPCGLPQTHGSVIGRMNWLTFHTLPLFLSRMRCILRNHFAYFKVYASVFTTHVFSNNRFRILFQYESVCLSFVLCKKSTHTWFRLRTRRFKNTHKIFFRSDDVIITRKQLVLRFIHVSFTRKRVFFFVTDSFFVYT
jgi:hypothetical protein